MVKAGKGEPEKLEEPNCHILQTLVLKRANKVDEWDHMKIRIELPMSNMCILRLREKELLLFGSGHDRVPCYEKRYAVEQSAGGKDTACIFFLDHNSFYKIDHDQKMALSS